MKKSLQILALMLFVSAASFAQVTKISSNKSLQISFPISNTKAILISEIDSTLWVSDATAAGTFQLSPTVKYEDGGTLINGKFIFPGKTTATGTELWITDGTVAGTFLLKDIYSNAPSSNPDDFAILNGVVYFTAQTPGEGRELWRTDGTTGGTNIVKDIVTGPVGSNTAGDYSIFSTGTYMLLAVTTPDEGTELWKSDGTSGGTVPLKNIYPGVNSSNPDYFYKYNNIVLFAAKDPEHGMELWKTDGTTGGTEMVKDINPGVANSITFMFFYLFNGRAYFTANDGASGDELWSTDGTTANTNILKDIFPGPVSSYSSLFSSVNIGNKLIFSAMDPDYGAELWETDGTKDGTKLFKDIVSGSESSSSFIIPNFDFINGTQTAKLFKGNKFFLMVSTPETGFELWVSDGTADGTKMVKEIGAGKKNGIESPSFAYTANAMYFVANNGTKGSELWKTDGTEAGTDIFADIYPGTKSSNPSLGFFPVNNKIILEANDGDHLTATDLFVIDGDNVTLPVKLLDFTVAVKADDAVLQWSTSQEVNSKDYSVQRSNDGKNFSTIASVTAAGTSSAKRTYSYTDAGIVKSANEIIYYRVIMNDKDGKSENTKVISVKLKGNSVWSIKLNNNPVINNMNVVVNGITNNLQISVKDINGKTVYNTGGITANGLISVPSDKLTPGVYVLVADYNNERKVIRFVKQ